MRRRVRQWLVTLCVLCAVCCVLPARGFAQVPHLIRYQGQAVDSQGIPLEGPYTMTFRLYDAAAGGNELWEEEQMSVPMSGGHFSVLLGQVTSLGAVDWSQPRWLSVQVNSEPELSPRQQITSVPLALRALTAERLDAPTTAQSNLVAFSRTAAAGAGPQAVGGMGFQPSALWVVCTDDASSPHASWGVGDDDADEARLRGYSGTDYTVATANLIDVGPGNEMQAALTSLDSDGFTVEWVKNGAGLDVTCLAMGVK